MASTKASCNNDCSTITDTHKIGGEYYFIFGSLIIKGVFMGEKDKFLENNYIIQQLNEYNDVENEYSVNKELLFENLEDVKEYLKSKNENFEEYEIHEINS